jgi:acetyl esterase
MEARIFARVMGVFAAALALGVYGPASAQDMCAPSEQTDPQPLHINGATPYVYKSVEGVDLRLHVFSLPGRPIGKRVPAVVFFYGGGWVLGDLRRYQTQATHLALRGLVTVLVDYRVKCRYGSTIMDAIADGKSAMRWVRSHSDELGVDPSRIAAVGSSAGGTLAASMALVPGFDGPADKLIDPRPNALILYNPGLDMASPSAHERLTKKFGEAIADHGREFSPIDHLDASLPPTIIFQGTADLPAIMGPVADFAKRAKALKRQCEVVYYRGAPHGFTEVWIPLDDETWTLLGKNIAQRLSSERWAEDTSRRTDAFLTRLGWLPQRGAAQ